MNNVVSNVNIVHLTSAHRRYDTRIFIKECLSLAKCQRYTVALIVADGNGDEEKSGVLIYDVGQSFGRLNRITKITYRVYKKALSLAADIYHLHDPELIPIGLRLIKKGKKVIFDAHEDLPKQILSKPYLKPWQAKCLSLAIKKYEAYALSKYTGIIASTPFIEKKFLTINKKTLSINNYPIANELVNERSQNLPAHSPTYPPTHLPINLVCYIGGLSAVRGIKEIVLAMEKTQTNAKLQIAGAFSEAHFEQSVKSLNGWDKVEALGFLDREGIKNTLNRSIAGLVTLHPIINYRDALPVKMFEYMSVGLPVIASDFPLWREIIESNHCGICVDPLNPNAIASAIDYLVEHPNRAQQMGKNGQLAVAKKYRWAIEEAKLMAFYQQLTPDMSTEDMPIEELN